MSRKVVNLGTNEWPRFFLSDATDFSVDQMLIPIQYEVLGRMYWGFREGNNELTGQLMFLDHDYPVDQFEYWRRRVLLTIMTPPERLEQAMQEEERRTREGQHHNQNAAVVVAPQLQQNQRERGAVVPASGPSSSGQQHQQQQGTSQVTCIINVTTTAGTQGIGTGPVMASITTGVTSASSSVTARGDVVITGTPGTSKCVTGSKNKQTVETSVQSENMHTTSILSSPPRNVKEEMYEEEPKCSTPVAGTSQKRKFEDVSPGQTPSPIKTKPRMGSSDDDSIKQELSDGQCSSSCGEEFYTAMMEESATPNILTKIHDHFTKILLVREKVHPTGLRCNQKQPKCVTFLGTVSTLPMLMKVIHFFMTMADLLIAVLHSAHNDQIPESVMNRINEVENEKPQFLTSDCERFCQVIEASLSRNEPIHALIRSVYGNSDNRKFYLSNQGDEIALCLCKSFILKDLDEFESIVEKSNTGPLGQTECVKPSSSWFAKTGSSFFSRMYDFIETPNFNNTTINGLPENFNTTSFSLDLISTLFKQPMEEERKNQVWIAYRGLALSEMKKLQTILPNLISKNPVIIEKYVTLEKFPKFTIVEVQGPQAIAVQLAETHGYDASYWQSFTTYMAKLMKELNLIDDTKLDVISKIDLLGIRFLIDLGFYEIQLASTHEISKFLPLFADMSKDDDEHTQVIRLMSRQVVRNLNHCYIRAKIWQLTDMAAVRLGIERTFDQLIFLLQKDFYSRLIPNEPQLPFASSRFEALSKKLINASTLPVDLNVIGGDEMDQDKRGLRFLGQDLKKRNQVVLLLVQVNNLLQYTFRTLDGTEINLFSNENEDTIRNFDIRNDGHKLHETLVKAIMGFVKANRKFNLNLAHIGTDTVEGGVLAICVERFRLEYTSVEVTTLPLRLVTFYYHDLSEGVVTVEGLLNDCWNAVLHRTGYFSERLGRILDMVTEEKKKIKLMEWQFLLGNDGSFIHDILCTYATVAVSRSRIDIKRCIDHPAYAQAIRFLLHVGEERMMEISTALEITKSTFSTIELHELVRTAEKIQILELCGLTNEEAFNYGHFFVFGGFEIDDSFRMYQNFFNTLVLEQQKPLLWQSIQTTDQNRLTFMRNIFNTSFYGFNFGLGVDRYMNYRCKRPDGFMSSPDEFAKFSNECYGLIENVYLYSFCCEKAQRFTVAHIFPDYLLESLEKALRYRENIPVPRNVDYSAENYTPRQIAQAQLLVLASYHKYLRPKVANIDFYRQICKPIWLKPAHSFLVTLQSFSEEYKVDSAALILQMCYLDIQKNDRISGRLIKTIDIRQTSPSQQMLRNFGNICETFQTRFVLSVIGQDAEQNPVGSLFNLVPNLDEFRYVTNRDRRLMLSPCLKLGGWPSHLAVDHRFKEGDPEPRKSI